MIQTTNRLSRGARMRRGSPIWAYAAVIAAVLAAVALLAVLKR